ncbi:MAG: radical SAM protein, partial [Rhodobacterales bacterium]|nr:radical SAM protein [Rhodobacterales bacterium]
MTDLYSLDQTALSALLKDWGFPEFRAKQVWHWIHDKGVTEFEEMPNLPQVLRDKLKTDARLGTLEVVAEEESIDGTVKRLYRLGDGQVVESVLMPYSDGRRTACISSQAGCAMGCVFCATGQMGFVRNLTATEIFEQAKRFADDLSAREERLSNVVLMGMGEPFHNYDAVMEAIDRLRTDLGI